MKPGQSKQVTQAQRVAFREDLAKCSIGAYRRQCAAIGVFTILFLVLLGSHQISDYLSNDVRPEHLSISHYYYDNGVISIPFLDLTGFRFGDVFVGFLSAVGIFLLLFAGLSIWEDRCLSLAGLMLLGVVLVPTSFDQPSPNFISVHFVCAVLFFILIAIVAIYFGAGRAKYAAWTAHVKPLTTSFNIIGHLMWTLPLTVLALHYFRPISDWVFIVEWLAILCFAIFWLVKFVEYDKILVNEQLHRT